MKRESKCSVVGEVEAAASACVRGVSDPFNALGDLIRGLSSALSARLSVLERPGAPLRFLFIYLFTFVCHTGVHPLSEAQISQKQLAWWWWWWWARVPARGARACC